MLCHQCPMVERPPPDMTMRLGYGKPVRKRRVHAVAPLAGGRWVCPCCTQNTASLATGTVTHTPRARTHGMCAFTPGLVHPCTQLSVWHQSSPSSCLSRSGPVHIRTLLAQVRRHSPRGVHHHWAVPW